MFVFLYAEAVSNTSAECTALSVKQYYECPHAPATMKESKTGQAIVAEWSWPIIPGPCATRIIHLSIHNIRIASQHDTTAQRRRNKVLRKLFWLPDVSGYNYSDFCFHFTYIYLTLLIVPAELVEVNCVKVKNKQSNLKLYRIRNTIEHFNKKQNQSLLSLNQTI